MGPLSLVALLSASVPGPQATRLFAEFRGSAPLSATAIFEDLAERELLEPHRLYPRLDGAREELRALRTFEKTCARADSPEPRWPKAWRFIAAACSKTKLDAGFFAEPPFVHPLGGSFLRRALAAELVTADLRAAPPSRWLHALELDAAKARGDVRLGLDATAALALGTGQPVALGREAVFVRSSGEGPLRYEVYARADWDRWVKRQPVRLVPNSPGLGCVETAGVYCWVRPLEELTDRLEGLRRSLLALLLSVGLAGLGFGLWFVLLRIREARERGFVFRMLAHELRTPMTSLALQVDALRREYDDLPGTSQGRVLEISAQVERLRRLVIGSERYLGWTKNSPTPEAPAVSVNTLLQNVGERGGEGLQLVPLDADRDLPGDYFWIEVALKSLIENAFEHGAPPVVLSAVIRDAELVLEVADRGTQPKRRSNPGRGFGLVLVRRVADRAGGRLEVLAGPTRYRLVMPARAR